MVSDIKYQGGDQKFHEALPDSYDLADEWTLSKHNYLSW